MSTYVFYCDCFQREMNFKTFCRLDYYTKFTKTETAIEICAAKQTELNMNLSRTVRNAFVEDEIFGNILELNAIIRSYIKELFDSSMEIVHTYNDTFVTHAKLKEVCTDTFDMIELIWFYPIMDSLLDSLFIGIHDIRTCQKMFTEAYVIPHDWDFHAELEELEQEI